MKFFPRTRLGVAWRALLGGLLVIAFAAGATATYGLLKVKEIGNELNQNPALNVSTQLPAPGKPETLLLVGSDHRFGEGKSESNTDTMMLVRINDNSSTINMLSIPRDLAVQIDGETAKLNSAWSDGGPAELLKVLRQQVFPGLQVNHVINIDFGGFAALINAIGGVYTMVDHRYYNDNTDVYDTATNFSSIDIQPGYQRLTGGGGNSGNASSALAFVRFRHSDSDLLRESRQQDFLRWAKSQFSTGRLASHEGSLLKTLGKHISADKSLHTTDGLIDMANLAINADGHQLKSLQFPVTGYPVIGGADYVSSTLAESSAVYKRFLTPTPIPSSSATKPKSKPNTSAHRAHHSTALKIPDGLSADPEDGKSQANELGPVPFPVYYPKYIPSTSFYCFSTSTGTGNDNDCGLDFEPVSAYEHSYPRRYKINGPGGHKYPSYVMTLQYPNLDDVFFNVEGTTWRNAPIVRGKPTKVQTLDGKKLDEYYSGAGNLSLVAWKTSKDVYWIANSLQDVVPPAQMVAMAATLTPAG